MLVLAVLPGRRQGLLIAAQAVVEDSGHPVRPRHRASLPSGCGLLEGGLDQRGGLGFPAPERGQHGGGKRHVAGPGRRTDRIGLRDQRGAGPEVTAPHGVHGHGGQQDRKLAEGAGLAGELDLPCGQVPVVIPQSVARRRGQPAPPERLGCGDVCAGKGASCLPQRRGGGGRPVGDQQRQAVQQQVARPRRVRRRGQPLGGAGDLQHMAGAGQMPGEPRCLVGVQVGLAGQVQVERLQPPGRLQQQRGRVAVQPRGERDLPAQQVRPGALQLIQRPGLRHGQQVQRLAERAGPQAGLRRGQHAPGAARRIGRQRRRPLPERRGGGQPAAGLRPARPTVRARRPRPHPDRPRPRPGARPAGPGRPAGRWPRPAPRAPPACPGPGPTGRPPSGPADAGTAPGRRTRSGPPPPPAAPPPRRLPSCPAARHTSTGSPVGSAAATSSSRRV